MVDTFAVTVILVAVFVGLLALIIIGLCSRLIAGNK